MKSILLVMSTLAITIGCAQESQSELNTVHERSENVQIVSAKRKGNLCFRYSGGPSDCSGYTVIKPHEQCHEESKHDNGDYTYLRYDCTSALEKTVGQPSLAPLKVNGTRKNGQQEIYYNTFYWTHTIRMAVRSAALSAHSFQGIGFYADETGFSSYNPSSVAPGGPDVGRFTSAQKLKRSEMVTLKDGSPAQIVEFTAPIEMTAGGSSYAHALFVRPFAKFVANGEDYWTWDSVASDYLLWHRGEFDRSHDVLK